jgi:hypothetical protein
VLPLTYSSAGCRSAECRCAACRGASTAGAIKIGELASMLKKTFSSSSFGAPDKLARLSPRKNFQRCLIIVSRADPNVLDQPEKLRVKQPGILCQSISDEVKKVLQHWHWLHLKNVLQMIGKFLSRQQRSYE